MNGNESTNRKMTSEERKMRILRERFEMDGKAMMGEWFYCEDDFRECYEIIGGYIVG